MTPFLAQETVQNVKCLAGSERGGGVGQEIVEFQMTDPKA